MTEPTPWRCNFFKIFGHWLTDRITDHINRALQEPKMNSRIREIPDKYSLAEVLAIGLSAIPKRHGVVYDTSRYDQLVKEAYSVINERGVSGLVPNPPAPEPPIEENIKTIIKAHNGLVAKVFELEKRFNQAEQQQQHTQNRVTIPEFLPGD